MREGNLVPADAKPTIAASWIALHILSNTESLAKRMSNMATCSHVNHITPRKPMYTVKASPFVISCVAVKVERFATKKRSKKSSMGVASAWCKNRGLPFVTRTGLAIHGKGARRLKASELESISGEAKLTMDRCANGRGYVTVGGTWTGSEMEA